MFEKHLEAKSKGTVVGSIDVMNADTLAECVEIAGTEVDVIKLFNQQFNTNTINSLRKPLGANKKALETYDRCIDVKVSHADALAIAGLTEATLTAAQEAANLVGETVDSPEAV